MRQFYQQVLKALSPTHNPNYFFTPPSLMSLVQATILSHQGWCNNQPLTSRSHSNPSCSPFLVMGMWTTSCYPSALVLHLYLDEVQNLYHGPQNWTKGPVKSWPYQVLCNELAILPSLPHWILAHQLSFNFFFFAKAKAYSNVGSMHLMFPLPGSLHRCWFSSGSDLSSNVPTKSFPALFSTPSRSLSADLLLWRLHRNWVLLCKMVPKHFI